MKGWLIVNRFLNNGKFNELYSWLITAAEKTGDELILLTNADIIVRADTGKIMYPGLDADRPDYVIFWDKDIRLARALEASGLKLYNCADAIEACDDKSLTCSRLAGIVPMPATYNVPFTYSGPGYCSTDFLKQTEALTGFPFVLKECFGSFGEQVYLIHSHEECISVLQSLDGRPCIIQEYLPTTGYAYPEHDGHPINMAHRSDVHSSGSIHIRDINNRAADRCNNNTHNGNITGMDIRIIVVGGKYIASMIRYNDNDFRANVALGGQVKAYTPTEEEAKIAIKAFHALKLDYAGVDILKESNGEPFLCEVNSNAHFKGIYECTGINAADAIIGHIHNQLL